VFGVEERAGSGVGNDVMLESAKECGEACAAADGDDAPCGGLDLLTGPSVG